MYEGYKLDSGTLIMGRKEQDYGVGVQVSENDERELLEIDRFGCDIRAKVQ